MNNDGQFYANTQLSFDYNDTSYLPFFSDSPIAVLKVGGVNNFGVLKLNESSIIGANAGLIFVTGAGDAFTSINQDGSLTLAGPLNVRQLYETPTGSGALNLFVDMAGELCSVSGQSGISGKRTYLHDGSTISSVESAKNVISTSDINIGSNSGITRLGRTIGGSMASTAIEISDRMGYTSDVSFPDGFTIDETLNSFPGKMGVATLVNGSVDVSAGRTKPNSRIFVSIQEAGTGIVGAVYVASRTQYTGFTIKSTSATDNSLVAWVVIDPTPT